MDKPQPSTKSHQPLILVVDDDPLSRQVIIDILGQLGSSDETLLKYAKFQVLAASNGDEAERLAIKSVPDAILMDWQMPGISGVEVMKRLKQKETTKDIPVLMVTSATSEEKLQEAFEAGAVDYITKPVKEIELLVRVKSVLRTSRYHQEILEQKREIEEQKKDITDSIRYASDIQAAILPGDEEIRKALPMSFVLFKPKDIVSGDFYWFGKKEKKIILAACDCTGHGVPGAFVSMVGNDLLDQIVVEKGIADPAQVLAMLNAGIIKVFGGTNTIQDKDRSWEGANSGEENMSAESSGSRQEVQDGMDLALCVFDEDLSQLEFAGARNPLYHVRDNILTEIKSDKQSIGGRTDIDYNFTKHHIELQTGDNIYIFSDGYCDQMGGPRERKYMAKKFKRLLLKINDKSPNDKKQALDSAITKWKGELEQIDDILVIGVKV